MKLHKVSADISKSQHPAAEGQSGAWVTASIVTEQNMTYPIAGLVWSGG